MYKICKKSITIDGADKTVYGIRSEEINVEDISADFESVKHLVAQLNKEDVSVDHILEIIEDFIIAN